MPDVSTKTFKLVGLLDIKKDLDSMPHPHHQEVKIALGDISYPNGEISQGLIADGSVDCAIDRLIGQLEKLRREAKVKLNKDNGKIKQHFKKHLDTTHN